MHPAFGYPGGMRTGGTAATEFGRYKYLAHRFGLGIVHSACVDFDQAEIIRCAEGEGGCFTGLLLSLVFEFVIGGKRQEFEGFATE